MKTFLLLKLLTPLLIVIGLTAVANLTGKWTNTDLKLSFKFKQQDSILTGALAGPDGTGDISNGKVSGDNFSFDLEKTYSGVVHWTGKYYGDSITTDFTTTKGAFHLKFNRSE